MAYVLNITQQQTANYVPGRTQGFRLLLTATVVSGFTDAGVFLFLQNGTSQYFQSVCSVADLTDYRTDTPSEEGFIRLSAIDLLFACESLSNDALQGILADIQVLCTQMQKVTSSGDLSVPVSLTISS